MNVMIKLKFTKDINKINEYIERLKQETNSFIYDENYKWINMFPSEIRIPKDNFPFTSETDFINQPGYILIRGKIDTREWRLTKELDFIENIYRDSRVHFTTSISRDDYPRDTTQPNIDTIRRELNIHKLWSKNLYGKDIVVGVVDSGIEKVSSSSEYPSFPQVIGGYPTHNFGTISSWESHGNMVAFDILTMAPKVKLLDIRIADHIDSGRISDVVKAYEWVEKHYINNGTPHILNNSWALYDRMSDLAYAHNFDHPITEWVAKLVSMGISTIFAAGNCGCSSDPRCGKSHGYDKSIWGANSHASVITVGAVKYVKPKDYVIEKYSSVGQGSLTYKKPDLVCYSNLKLRDKRHTGTSVSAPLVSGILALLYQKNNNIDPFTLKKILIETSTKNHRHLSSFSKKYGHGLINPLEVERHI